MSTSNRRKNAKLNMITGLLQEMITLICGLILPRVILSRFGSSYNGIVNSVTQFMSFSAVLRSGLGAVTHAALYKPLAERDYDKISGIMVATGNFMRKVGYILAIMIIGFAFAYPFVVDEFDYLFSFSLVLIIGVSSFIESMFSVKYKILLQADQKYYIQTISVVASQILSTLFAVVIALNGGNIHMVRLSMVLANVITPLMLNWYVKKNYRVDWKHEPDNIALNQRWDAFAHQLSVIINNNVDVIILTMMVPMKEISVYSVYYMVVHNINKLISSCLNGIKAVFGDMIVRGEKSHLQKRFQEVEWALFAACTIAFSVTAIMLTPFVMIYTKGITDVDYSQYTFGLVMVSVHMFSVMRIPFQNVVEAAGHFKQTRNGAILEVILNIVFSLIFVYFYGTIGVLAGTAVAMFIRTTQFGVYACRKIVELPVRHMLKNYTVYFSSACVLVLVFRKFVPENMSGYVEWLLYACAVGVGCVLFVAVISLIFNRSQTAGVVNQVLRRRRKK